LLIVDWWLPGRRIANQSSTIKTIQQSKIIKSTIESQAARQAGCWQSQRNSILSPACLQ
jgi:hypothetical protein